MSRKIYIIILVLIYMISCYSCIPISNNAADRSSYSFEELMEKAYNFEKEGYLAKALQFYKDALKIHPDDERCSQKVIELDGIISGQSRYSSSPDNTNYDDLPHGNENRYPVIDVGRKKTLLIVHKIKRGETLSDIAMYYYDTYKTRIYYKAGEKRFMTADAARRYLGEERIGKYQIGNVSDMLEKINDLNASNLEVGREMRIPRIEGLAFMKDEPAKNPIPNQRIDRPVIPRRTQKQDPESSTKEREGKPSGKRADSIINEAISYYRKAEFGKSKSLFMEYLDDERMASKQNDQIALVYVALIEMAFGNEEKTNAYLSRLLSGYQLRTLSEIESRVRNIFDDITPDLKNRYQKLRESFRIK